MRKNFRNKFAALAACVSILGSETSAMNSNKIEVKKTQTIVKAEGRTQPKKINWKNIVKIGGLVVAGGAVVETIHSLIGGFTDSKLGKWSIGEVIKNRLKKNKQPDLAGLGESKDRKLNEKRYFSRSKLEIPRALYGNDILIEALSKLALENAQDSLGLISRAEKAFNKDENKINYFLKILNIMRSYKFSTEHENKLKELLSTICKGRLRINDSIFYDEGYIVIELGDNKYRLGIRLGDVLLIEKNNEKIAEIKLT